MFTGIVEEIGVIERIDNHSMSSQMIVTCCKVLTDSKLGDSIAVDGVCLTVCKILPQGFVANVMSETLQRTNFAVMQKGTKVNLERALMLTSRLGGHMVSGHIDGTTTVMSKRQQGNAQWIEIKMRDKMEPFIVEKGSIAINGVSLTVAAADRQKFAVSLIPTTLLDTTLHSLSEGQLLNIECDIIGKYVAKSVTKQSEGSMNIDFLRKYGFA